MLGGGLGLLAGRGPMWGLGPGWGMGYGGFGYGGWGYHGGFYGGGGYHDTDINHTTTNVTNNYYDTNPEGEVEGDGNGGNETVEQPQVEQPPEQDYQQNGELYDQGTATKFD